MFKYRDEATAKRIVRDLRDMGVRANLMHVCGTHQDTIVRFGLLPMLEEAGIVVHQGPGCPVCVTTSKEIADAVTLARNGVTVTAFGDMMRVPTTAGSLFDAKAEGADVRVVYSIEDAVRMAREQKDRPFVFVGVGFETTAPSAGVPLARGDAPDNFSLYSCHRYTDAAIRAILDMGENRIDGIIEPGHVAVVTGLDPFREFRDRYRVPQVVAGFEPLDMLMAAYMLCRQIYDGRVDLENEYSRVVKEHGNLKARAVLDEVFEPADRNWRGFPVLRRSAMRIKAKYGQYDAAKVHEDVLRLAPEVADEAKGCNCGQVLRGLIESHECPMFAKGCTPAHPIGPCMVSSEGNCSIAYRFRGPLG